jgi:mono/diheme cytochrome c family protein
VSHAFICDFARTPIGRYGGALKDVRTDDLAAHPLRVLKARHAGIDWEAVDDVILGCANQAGEDNRNVARMAVLLSGLPVTVPGTTINRLCGSGLDAVAMAARAIRGGDAELVIAGGVESMTRAPFVQGKATEAFSRQIEVFDTTIGWRFVNPLLKAQYGIDSMPETGENVAEQFKVSREEQDLFAWRSQQRTRAAQDAGFFQREIVPIDVPAAVPSPRHAGWIYGLGRLKAGVAVERAEQELAALSAQFEHDFPSENEGAQYYASPLRDALVGDTRRPLLLLLASVGFILLIACANVGNLLLARSLGRQSEMAMRLALGAGRGRLVAQTFTEGLVLAAAGGLVGVFVAWRAAPALAAMMPRAVDVPGLDRVGLNPWVLAFSVAASLAAAAVASGVACVGLVRDADRANLTGARRTTMSRGARRAASSLVAAEIALAVVLLIGGGLTLRSFAKLVADAKAAQTAITDEKSFKAKFPDVAGNCGGCHKIYREQK